MWTDPASRPAFHSASVRTSSTSAPWSIRLLTVATLSLATPLGSECAAAPDAEDRWRAVNDTKLTATTATSARANHIPFFIMPPSWFRASMPQAATPGHGAGYQQHQGGRHQTTADRPHLDQSL